MSSPVSRRLACLRPSGRRRSPSASKMQHRSSSTICLLMLAGWLSASTSERALGQTSLLSSVYLPAASSSSEPSERAPLGRRDLALGSARGARRQQPVCQVSDGESVAILEIVESRGSEMSQPTSPAELPISGSTQLGEIELRIESETHRYFQIKEKRLTLTRPLDRDGVLKENSSQLLLQQQPISSVYLQISCLDKRPSESAAAASKKVIIPVLVKVLDVNDNAPTFGAQLYEAQVSELAPTGSVVFDQIRALDLDAASNGQVEYSLAGAATPPQRLVARERPSVDLQGEPIANGPLEEADEEEEAADEAALAAALNSTLADGERRRRRSPPQRPEGADLWTDLLAASVGGGGDEWAAGGEQRRAAALARDSLEHFELEMLDGRPLVKLRKPLDYEARRLHLLQVVASDRGGERLSSAASLLVRVLDGDDQPPAFVLDQGGCATAPATSTPASVRRRRRHLADPAANFRASDDNFDFGDPPAPSAAAPYSCLAAGGPLPEYFASVAAGDSEQLLRLSPQAIRARDRDQLNAPIRYAFLNGTPPTYAAHFQLNPVEASVKQVAPVEAAGRFEIWVQAEEQTERKQVALAKLTIEVLASERAPPILVASSPSGFVEENAPLGSRVQQQVAGSSNRSALRLQVLNGLGNQQYEFETTSDAFRVDRDGFLLVNRWPLDRDPPGGQPLHRFQVLARLAGAAGSSRALSSPVSLNVSLLDVDDNPPVLLARSLERALLPASGQPGARQRVRRLEALDLDEPEQARTRFALRHASNGARDRFRLDAESGELEALGRFQAGEQFSLTLEASDSLGRASQGILEVEVAPGPNSGGPQFLAQAEGAELEGGRGFSIELSEGLAPHSPVLQLRAVDPDQDPITFSIVDGNAHQHFQINPKSGLISTSRRLDREEIAAYKLLVQARDPAGLSSHRQLHIQLTDINDSNPHFERHAYAFDQEEGPCSVVGRVQASDPDAGDNGRLSYRLVAGQEQFALDERTGELRCLAPLDFERHRLHKLLVEARDAGEPPRSSTCSVQVRVLDKQDEAPYFERYFIESRLNESHQLGLQVGQVQALDPDQVAQISYVLLAGDASLFSVDQQTGVVSNRRPLDFEEKQRHTLLVGTLEHQESDDLEEVARLLASQQQVERSPVCRLDLQLVDVNDEPPEFVGGQPLPARVQDSAPPGHLVARLRATDRDASEPNNQVRFELIEEQDECSAAFLVDASSGQVSVRADLRKLTVSECQLQVLARDLGQQPGSLSARSTLTVFVDHLAEPAPVSQLGFADSHYTVELEEDAGPDQLVKLVPVINKPRGLAVHCELLGGADRFQVKLSESGDCELRTASQLSPAALDFELQRRHSLSLRLSTPANPTARRHTCQVQVNILDRNDNRPQFQAPARYARLTQGRFLAALAADAPTDSQLIQVRAQDADSAQANGQVSYELANADELDARFRVEPLDGQVRTCRPLEDVPASRLPLRLRVRARDHPEQPAEALESTAEVLVNLIEERHRVALVLRDTPASRVLDAKEELLSALQERTGMISGLERVEALKVQRNGSLESDVAGSDFWFYLVEPGSLRLVASDDARLRASLFESRAQSSLQDVLSQTLGFHRVRVRLPFAGQPAARSTALGRLRALAGGDQLAALLLVGGLCIGLLAAVLLVFQCGSWSTSRSLKDNFYLQQQQQRLAGHLYPAAPGDAYQSALSTLAGSAASKSAELGGYQPLEPGAFLKAKQEYETQMLKMSVLFDDTNSLGG